MVFALKLVVIVCIVCVGVLLTMLIVWGILNVIDEIHAHYDGGSLRAARRNREKEILRRTVSFMEMGFSEDLAREKALREMSKEATATENV